MPVNTTLRLEPSDEYCHPVEEAPSFNESMYANVLDGPGRLGVWVRVGNRPNEGHAEVTCCVYLPDGRVGFMFARPSCTSNETLSAAGASFVVEEPFQRVRMEYDGPLCVLDDPLQMADPKAAFLSNPIVPARVSVVLEGLVEPYGGEPADPASESPLTAFARGHYEQHVRGVGFVEVDGVRHELDGLGLRDHSWGPRYWQNLAWYRFMPLAFTPDFAMCVVLVADHDEGLHPGGMVLRVGPDGARGYVDILDARFETTYDSSDHAIAQTMTVTTAERTYVVRGSAMSLIPLRNRRAGLVTRITEAMSRFECTVDGPVDGPVDGAGEVVGYGMSEYLDQLVDGRPNGLHS